MLEKISIGLLTMVYMIVVSGIAMEIHYCMGQQAGVEFYGSSDDQCGKCGMTEKKTGCCHDEHKFFKLEDSHKNVSNNLSFEAGEKYIVNHYAGYQWVMATTASVPTVNNHSPPGHTDPPARILHGVFRL
ncbi:MAG: hypothetical protein IPI66_12460 [Chitinophagaceae bacterium]|nr:hypothetical protein [Chitinophagaceae bacterium]